jgi:glycine/D-amino acid oxidase-like deaminating enzyme
VIVMAGGVIEYFDVLIVGAGISGIGGAYHLTKQCPGTSFVVLESQESFGGTWLTHRYPGIRSDSDLYTFGYRFKPWTSAPIATAAEILKYMGEVIEENGLAPHIRYRHQIHSVVKHRQPVDGRGGPVGYGRRDPFHRQLLVDRGDKPEWQHTQDYWTEKDVFPAIDLDDSIFVYG